MTRKNMGLISVGDAARRFPLSERRIRQLLESGTVRGIKIGRTWAVDDGSLKAYVKLARRPGRKPKRA